MNEMLLFLFWQESESARQDVDWLKSIPMNHSAEEVLVGRYFIQLHIRGSSGGETD